MEKAVRKTAGYRKWTVVYTIDHVTGKRAVLRQQMRLNLWQLMKLLTRMARRISRRSQKNYKGWTVFPVGVRNTVRGKCRDVTVQDFCSDNLFLIKHGYLLYGVRNGWKMQMKQTGFPWWKRPAGLQICGGGPKGGDNVMDGQYVSMEVHKEFEKRMTSENERLGDEDRRQNRRIDALEDTVRQIGDLTASVKELAVSMKNMAKLQELQGQDIEELKNRDGEMWRKVAGYIITLVIGIVISFIFTQTGM